jgi:hypothetical protein
LDSSCCSLSDIMLDLSMNLHSLFFHAGCAYLITANESIIFYLDLICTSLPWKFFLFC